MSTRRICPKCQNLIVYSNKYKCNRAEISNSICKFCHKTRGTSGPFVRICPNCSTEIKYSYHRNLLEAQRNNYRCNHCKNLGERNGIFGVRRPEAVRAAISKNHRRTWKGRKHTAETKQKMRTSAINWLSTTKGQLYPRYNKSACELFNEINRRLGWNGIHAENGGEYFISNLGYWVDYYEPENNVVIEFDEDFHSKPKHQVRDSQRQREIIDFLKCKFYRIRDNQDEWENVLKEEYCTT